MDGTFRTYLLPNPLHGTPTLKLCFGCLLVGILTPLHNPMIPTISKEHITNTPIIPNVVGALFGVYLFYTSQMSGKDKLHAISQIPIPISESLLFPLRTVLTH